MPQKNMKQKSTLDELGHSLILMVFLFGTILMPFLNSIIVIVLNVNHQSFIRWLTIFALYGVSLFLIWLPARCLKLKKVPRKEEVISPRGFVRTFPFYVLAVLSLSDYNAPSGNILGIAIGAAALVLYYQYVVEYSSKML